MKTAITRAAEKHIGRKNTTRKENRPGHSKKVKEAIKERNDLRHKAGEVGGREKWVKKCKEITEMIKQEKQESWKNYVEELDTKKNPRPQCNTIRNLE